MSTPHLHTLDEVRAVKPRALAVFESLGTVVSIGIILVGNGYGLKVNLREAVAEGTRVPTEVDGVPVRIAVTGQPRA